MSLKSKIGAVLNALLRRFNLRLQSLTAQRAETRRLLELERRGHFDRPLGKIPPCFLGSSHLEVLAEASAHRARFEDFAESSRNDVGYSYGNGWFDSPDAQILYAVGRKFRPGKIVEVGSGHSTRIARQAILDGGLKTRLVAVDPEPRSDVVELADQVFRRPVEEIDEAELFDLAPNDILFIDSSHLIETGNDVVHLYLRVVPELPAGVILHVHDVFLPFEYPRRWVVENRWGWNEQYLVQAMMIYGASFEALWPGHYLQRTQPELFRLFEGSPAGVAQSLWLRKTR